MAPFAMAEAFSQYGILRAGVLGSARGLARENVRVRSTYLEEQRGDSCLKWFTVGLEELE